jgi:hypothetical protein
MKAPTSGSKLNLMLNPHDTTLLIHHHRIRELERATTC